METTHGMEIIKFIKSSEIKEENLLSEVKEKFGNSTFHVCSNSDLSAEGIIDFLKENGKLVFKEGIAIVDCDGSCSAD